MANVSLLSRIFMEYMLFRRLLTG